MWTSHDWVDGHKTTPRGANVTGQTINQTHTIVHTVMVEKNQGAE